MRVNHQCRWVRHRLPLLAGGELGIEERRRVERHLIGCPGCRDHRDASSDALTALRSFAEESPARTDTPSLWPALALQIRQSRHVAARPPWWDIPLSRPWFVFSVVVGVGVVLASAYRRSPVHEQAAPVPILAKKTSVVKPPVLVLPTRKKALPEDLVHTPRPGALPQDGDRSTVSYSGLQFNYDLDHMIPMNLSNRDPQRSY